jgi:hypothetical protein
MHDGGDATPENSRILIRVYIDQGRVNVEDVVFIFRITITSS